MGDLLTVAPFNTGYSDSIMKILGLKEDSMLSLQQLEYFFLLVRCHVSYLPLTAHARRSFLQDRQFRVVRDVEGFDQVSDKMRDLWKATRSQSSRRQAQRTCWTLQALLEVKGSPTAAAFLDLSPAKKMDDSLVKASTGQLADVLMAFEMVCRFHPWYQVVSEDALNHPKEMRFLSLFLKILKEPARLAVIHESVLRLTDARWPRLLTYILDVSYSNSEDLEQFLDRLVELHHGSAGRVIAYVIAYLVTEAERCMQFGSPAAAFTIIHTAILGTKYKATFLDTIHQLKEGSMAKQFILANIAENCAKGHLNNLPVTFQE